MACAAGAQGVFPMKGASSAIKKTETFKLIFKKTFFGLMHVQNLAKFARESQKNEKNLLFCTCESGFAHCACEHNSPALI